MKACTKCFIEKPMEDFYQISLPKLRQTSACKACLIARSRKNVLANPELRQDWMMRSSTARKEYRKRYNIDHPDAHKAWVAANLDICRTRSKNAQRSSADRLADGYILHLLTQKTNLARTDIPQALVDAKREQLSIKRLTKQLNQEINNQLENTNGN